MPFIADEPPRPRPRGCMTLVPVCFIRTDISPQFWGVCISAGHAAGTADRRGKVRLPASSNSTRAEGSSDSRAANTQPAEPPPQQCSHTQT